MAVYQDERTVSVLCSAEESLGLPWFEEGSPSLPYSAEESFGLPWFEDGHLDLPWPYVLVA